jgi:hypothetical protein
LDDEPPRSPSGSQSALTKAADKESPADIAATQAPDEAVAPSPSADSQAKTPEKASPPEAAPDLSDLSPPETDWMSTLLEDETLSESAAVAEPVTLPSLSRPEVRKPGRSQEGPFGKLVKQPVFWVGVAGFVVAVLIVAIVLSLSSPSDEGPGQPRPSLPPAADTSAAPRSPSGEMPETPAKEAVPADLSETEPRGEPTARPGGGAEPGSSDGLATGPLEKPTTAGPGNGQRLPQPEDAGPTGAPGGERPRQQPGEAGQVLAAGDGAGKPPSPSPAGQRGLPGAGPGPEAGEGPEAPSPGEEPAKLDPTEMRARLAAISHLSFLLESADRNPNSKLNMLIRQEAIQAAERAGLTVTKDDAVVMHLTLETAEANGLVGFVMSAELKCRDSDSKALKLWEHKELVATVAPYLLRRPAVPAPLKTGIRDFFERFVRDRRGVQAEKDQTKASKPDL